MTDSLPVVSPLTRSTDSYGRTDGRTNEEPLDQGDSLTPHNAHDDDGDSAEFVTIGTALRAVTAQLEQAGERMPIVRSNRPGTVDPRIRKAVYMRDNYTCRWCGRHISIVIDPLEIDHVVPWSAGGSNATDNLRTLCAPCNTQRSNMRTDIDSVRPLLIVGHCVRCKGRRYLHWNESPTGIPGFVWDEDQRATDDYLEVAVWCVECRAPSTTASTHADEVRQRQANLYAPFPADGAA